MIKFLIKFFLYLHTFSYRAVTLLAPLVEKDELHPKHRIMNYHKFFLDNINEGDTVLDIGCGNGALTYDIAGKAKEVVALDINEDNVSLAKKKYWRENIEYVVGDAFKDLPKGVFDVIILSNFIEHIEGRIQFLKDLKDKYTFSSYFDTSLKFLIRVPLLDRDWITLYKKELGVSYKLDKSHFIEYTPETFEKEMNEAGLKVVSYSIQFGELWGVVK